MNTPLRQSIVYNNPLYDFSLKKTLAKNFPPLPPDDAIGNPQNGQALFNFVFTHQNQRYQSQVSFEHPLFWNPPTAQWFSFLHSFNWILDLRQLHSHPARDLARNLVISWLNHNAFWTKDTWTPPLLASRIIHWITSRDFFWATADQDFQFCILDSLARQTSHLAQTIRFETDPQQSLFFSVALGYGSLSLRNPTAVQRRIHSTLKHVLPLLFYDDGGSRSRNPQTHLQNLRYLLQICSVLYATKTPIPSYLSQSLDKISRIFSLTLHRDNSLALFHGADVGNPIHINNTLHDTNYPSPPSYAPEFGFARLSAHRAVAIIDLGTTAANPQFHASPLAFEFSIDTQRLIVNCGPSHPAARETRCHSTLTIDALNSADIFNPHHKTRVSIEQIPQPGAQRLLAHHTGYVSSYGFIHQRRLSLTNNGRILSGEDKLLIAPNLLSLNFTEAAQVALRFHLHPDVFPEILSSDSLRLSLADRLWIFTFKSDEKASLVLDNSFYYPTSQPQTTSQIVIYGQTTPTGCSFFWSLERAE